MSGYLVCMCLHFYSLIERIKKTNNYYIYDHKQLNTEYGTLIKSSLAIDGFHFRFKWNPLTRKKMIIRSNCNIAICKRLNRNRRKNRFNSKLSHSFFLFLGCIVILTFKYLKSECFFDSRRFAIPFEGAYGWIVSIPWIVQLLSIKEF